VPNPIKVTPQSRPVRGGNLFVNPRLEVRVPIRAVFINVSKSLEPFETVLFTDIGNLWVDPTYPFDNGKFPVRASVGTGVRFQTPIGPLAVDYGINVTRKAFEDFGNFHFAVGLF
jgi:outer membrane protein assembly factor BamA